MTLREVVAAVADVEVLVEDFVTLRTVRQAPVDRLLICWGLGIADTQPPRTAPITAAVANFIAAAVV